MRLNSKRILLGLRSSIKGLVIWIFFGIGLGLIQVVATKFLSQLMGQPSDWVTVVGTGQLFILASALAIRAAADAVFCDSFPLLIKAAVLLGCFLVVMVSSSGYAVALDPETNTNIIVDVSLWFYAAAVLASAVSLIGTELDNDVDSQLDS